MYIKIAQSTVNRQYYDYFHSLIILSNFFHLPNNLFVFFQFAVGRRVQLQKESVVFSNHDEKAYAN